MRLGTSLRTRTAGDTIARCRTLAQPLGIAQVTDITALDVLGLPVFVSARPDGRTSRIHAGKGLCAADAEAGAWMEAFECAVAERDSATAAYAPLRLGELAARLPGGLSLADFAPRLGVPLDAHRTLQALRCEDLMSLQRPLLPAELVALPAPPDESGQPALFGWSSNGLASGNTLEEATLHALMEVLERDTLAMSTVRGTEVVVDPLTLPQALAAHAARWQRQGITLFVRQLPGDFDLPCFEATLYQPGHARCELARGWGLHFDREVALARAVCEAAQSRLCQIHSQQEDVAPLYGTRIRVDSAVAVQARARFRSGLAQTAQSAGVDFRALPDVQHASIAAALGDLLARLRARGFAQAFRYHMGSDVAAEAGLHAVKVIVPRCETLLGDRRRAGPRLMGAAAERSQAA